MGQFVKPNNHGELFRRVASFSSVEAKCIAQCTGCQCNKTIYDVTDAYNFARNNNGMAAEKSASIAEFISPEKKIYQQMLGKITTDAQVTAAYCNCTACNSCRCDCSCRSIEFSSQSIW